ncbi:MAG: DUF5681 domain-containing protein [Bryobacteraceae bacterium]
MNQGQKPATGRSDTPAKAGDLHVRDPRGRFQPGVSGNRQGRKAGSRNRATIALQRLLEGEGEAITRKAVEMALGGDSTALRLVFERILPAPKDRPVIVDIPTLTGVATARDAIGRIIEQAAAGRLTPSEARTFAELVGTHMEASVLMDLEHRVASLERKP